MPGSVGGAEDQDSLVVSHVAIHLCQKLVDQGSHAAFPQIFSVSCQGIDLIEEQDCRSMITRDLEKLMQILLTIADVEIENLMEGNRDKIRPDLTSRGLTDQGLATAGRPIKQHTAS